MSKEWFPSWTSLAPYHYTSHGASGTHDMMIEVFGGLQKVAHEDCDPIEKAFVPQYIISGAPFPAEEVSYSASWTGLVFSSRARGYLLLAFQLIAAIDFRNIQIDCERQSFAVHGRLACYSWMQSCHPGSQSQQHGFSDALNIWHPFCQPSHEWPCGHTEQSWFPSPSWERIYFHISDPIQEA